MTGLSFPRRRESGLLFCLDPGLRRDDSSMGIHSASWKTLMTFKEQKMPLQKHYFNEYIMKDRKVKMSTELLKAGCGIL